MAIGVGLSIALALIGNGEEVWAQEAAAAKGIDSAAVQDAIDRGIAYLRANQNAAGGWKEYSGQTGGLSALCTLALLTAGVPANDPQLVRAIAYLRKLDPEETYSVALQTLALCQLGSATDLPRIRRNVDWLQTRQLRGAEVAEDRRGGWGYGDNRGGGDPSNSQFALLALQAAEERDIAVDPAAYQSAAEYWGRLQLDSGAWTYSPSTPPMGSMTCAGIASVIICRDQLATAGARIENGQIVCCGGDDQQRDPVQAGIDWLASKFSVRVNPGAPGSATLYYYLYALERVGRMTGRRFIGGHDWYREGAERLIQLQDGFQGFWAGTGIGEEDRNVATSFALLFLSKGKRKVAIGRLRYGATADRDDGTWQQHPDASRQIVRRLERLWGRDLTWQSVSLKDATVNDLLQTPFLMITVDGQVRWSEAESAVLKDYIDQGGAILFEASGGPGCGDTTAAEASVRALCGAWYPDAPLAPLSPDHPAYSAEVDVKPALISPEFQIQGVQACCRTAIFYSPLSLSCRWALSDPTGRGRVGGLARGKLEGAASDAAEMAARLGQNLIAYATGREFQDKLDSRMIVRSEPTTKAGDRRGIEIGRLPVDASAREARRAIPNLAAIANRELRLRVFPYEQEVAIKASTLANIGIVWIHGRGDFRWTDAEREEIRTYLRHGGMVIADSVCGNEAFATAFRRELRAILPDEPLKPLPPDHRALTNAFNGYDIRSVTIRSPAVGRGANVKLAEVGKRRGPPIIETASVDGFVAVIFSPLDLSCALESPNSIQCPGYDTVDASKIAINMILFILQQ
jgi:hypothetical protein